MGKKRHADWTCVRQLVLYGGRGACAYTKLCLGAGWNMYMCVVECDDERGVVLLFVLLSFYCL